MKTHSLVFTIGCIFLIGAPGCMAQPEPVNGTDGIGDPYFPKLGNGGYDVQKYSIALEVDPESNTVSGKTTIEANATQTLSAFNLDFQGLAVDSVSVDQLTAKFSRAKAEMTITPDKPLSLGHTFTVEVSYHGTPTIAPSQAVSADVGWFHTKDNNITVWTDPDGASTWFPNNNHPRDKALYHLEVKVPDPWVVAGTGTLTKTITEDGHTRYVIDMNEPAASYLIAINIGKYNLEQTEGPDGILIRNYFPPDYPKARKKNFAKLPEMIEYLSDLYGPFPFKEYGVVIVSPQLPICKFFGAEETQSLSIHCSGIEMASERVIVHELAHQWFGDSVSVENWKDLWLKEGMATYAEWSWATRDKDLDALTKMAKALMTGYHPSSAIGNPPPRSLYTEEVYRGGALVFHALRLQVGEEAFFKILHTYLERYRGGTAGTDEFVAVAEEISGQALQSFFDSWLLDNTLPEMPEPK